MESAPAPASPSARTSPKDFFLWLGAIIALYGGITSLITLLFRYVDFAFPDQLANYSDPYGNGVLPFIAAVIVLTPTVIVLFELIRRSIREEPGKVQIWVRRWALVLTLFIATVTILIDLITLITTFLGGEITERFALKVVLVLLIALGVFLHFLADLKGYWITEVRKARFVALGVAVLAVAVIAAGFLIIGTPGHIRMLRYDDQKVNDLQNIQSQVIDYWQAKRSLPAELGTIADPLSGYVIPTDPQAGHAYTYRTFGTLSFELCADFNTVTPDTAGRGAAYPLSYGPDMMMGDWKHPAGRTCFIRKIDPKRYATTPTGVLPGKPL